MKRLIEWYRGWREKRQQLKKREEYERRAGGSDSDSALAARAHAPYQGRR